MEVEYRRLEGDTSVDGLVTACHRTKAVEIVKEYVVCKQTAIEKNKTHITFT